MTARLLASLVLLAGCAADEPFTGPYRGVETTARAMPAVTLADTRGEPFELAARTRGRVTLLFFGYTSCPDVCPVHLANIAAVLHKLPDEIRRDVQVLFVTTDPARDSAAVLGPWVRGFDPEFVALSGSDSAVVAAQRALGLVPAVRQDVAGREYLVGHSSAVIAFDREGRTVAEYPFGTRQRDWAHDLPLLVAAGAATE